MYDICAHCSLPKSAIIAPGLLKKKEEMMNKFAWAAKTLLWISGASHFGSFKVLHQCRHYCREHLYSQISLKVRDSEEKSAFPSRLPLSHNIAQLAAISIDSGILVSLCASAHHPYKTLATGE